VNIFDKINDLIYYIVDLIGIWGPVLSCFLILIESIIPIIPLAVFITMNFMVFGNLLGFIISWIFTIVGCSLSFYLFRFGFYRMFKKYTRNKARLDNFMSVITNMSFGSLVVFLAIPFTPAFIINIAAGLSDIKYQKYLAALLIGKISMVYFWGYIGTSLIESIKNPVILLKVGIIVLIMYIISKIVNKKINL